MMNVTLSGKSDAGNLHAWFDEGEVASYPTTVGRSGGDATRGAKSRRGSLLYNVRKSLFLCVAGVATGLLFAEDLTVAVGESVTVSENATYDNVVVNGSLTVAAGKILSVMTLLIGDGSDGSKAEVFVESGAKINVSSTEIASPTILGNGNPAEMTLKPGAVFSTTGGVGIGKGMKPDGDAAPKIKLVLTEATFECADVMVTSYLSDDKNYPALAQVDLNGRSADLRVANLYVSGKNSKFRVRFNGGRMRFYQWYNYGKSSHIRTGANVNTECILESVDSNPIRIFSSSGSSGKALFNCPRGDGTIRLEGNGVVWNEGPGHRPLIHPDNVGKVIFGNAGGIWVPTGCSLLNSEKSAACLAQDYNAGCKLTVAAGGLFDLGGFDVSLDGIESAGVVTNASATVATLTVGKDGSDSVFVAPPAGGLPLVKTGSGSLKVPDGDLNRLSVVAGSVEFLNRRDAGFPYYRFYVDRKSNANIRLTEFAFLDGEADVTANWTAISRIEVGGYYYADPTGVVDRVEATKWDDRSWSIADARTNRCFFVTHFGGAPAFDFSWYAAPAKQLFENPSAPLVPVSISQKVTGYKLKENDKDGSYPLHWRFQGGFADGITENRWRDLDVVRNAACPGAQTWSGVYTASYTNSHVVVANLTLADESVWTLDVVQGLVEVDTLTPGHDVTVSVSGAKEATGRIVLPVRIGTVNGNLTGWKLHFADIPGAEDRPLVIQDGFLRTAPSGLILVVR